MSRECPLCKPAAAASQHTPEANKPNTSTSHKHKLNQEAALRSIAHTTHPAPSPTVKAGVTSAEEGRAGQTRGRSSIRRGNPHRVPHGVPQ